MNVITGWISLTIMPQAPKDPSVSSRLQVKAKPPRKGLRSRQGIEVLLLEGAGVPGEASVVGKRTGGQLYRLPT